MSFLLSLQQNWRRRQNRFCLEAGGGWVRRSLWGVGEGERVAQTMYTHMNKCINNFKNKNK
jgi:hypothetical protein